jgi:hypothetical protein
MAAAGIAATLQALKCTCITLASRLAALRARVRGEVHGVGAICSAHTRDPRFIREFKAKHCVEAMVEHVTQKKKRKLWRRKDQKFEYPYKEISVVPK